MLLRFSVGVTLNCTLASEYMLHNIWLLYTLTALVYRLLPLHIHEYPLRK